MSKFAFAKRESYICFVSERKQYKVIPENEFVSLVKFLYQFVSKKSRSPIKEVTDDLKLLGISATTLKNPSVGEIVKKERKKLKYSVPDEILEKLREETGDEKLRREQIVAEAMEQINKNRSKDPDDYQGSSMGNLGEKDGRQSGTRPRPNADGDFYQGGSE